jgi:hypothetical protein
MQQQVKTAEVSAHRTAPAFSMPCHVSSMQRLHSPREEERERAGARPAAAPGR